MIDTAALILWNAANARSRAAYRLRPITAGGRAEGPRTCRTCERDAEAGRKECLACRHRRYERNRTT